ncbi:MAG TPA: hypothetical protein VFA68_13220 [Terriglobales bacterium]|nr:hypothetical protein [Terriglobales bacterium]
MENYFNYFTEIEEHFQKRRGSILLLSTLDWALIETWKDAGIPLEAVLRGIDAAFESYEKRPSPRKVNSLAYCSQAVLSAAEDMKEAAVGTTRESKAGRGFESTEIAAFLERNATQLEAAEFAEPSPVAMRAVALEIAESLRDLAGELASSKALPRLEDVERRLTALEAKLFAALVTSSSEEQLVAVRAEADRELAPYKRKMSGPQIEQLHKQFLHKRLLEKSGLTRLSLFYM